MRVGFFVGEPKAEPDHEEGIEGDEADGKSVPMQLVLPNGHDQKDHGLDQADQEEEEPWRRHPRDFFEGLKPVGGVKA